MEHGRDAARVLSTGDWVVVFAVVSATLLAVVWGRLRQQTVVGSEQKRFVEHLLMGRTLTLPLFTATLVATWYGGIFGVTQAAFEHGICILLTQAVFWYGAYILFALFLVDRIVGFGAMSLPDLARRWFGARAAKIAAVFNFFDVLPVVYSVSIGFFCRALTGWPLWLCMAGGTAFVCCYCVLGGGFRAVVFSDAVQVVVMCTAVFVVIVFSWIHVGPPTVLPSLVPKRHFDPAGGFSLTEIAAWGMIALGTLVDPNFYHRCFAARDARTAKRGILLATFVWCGFDLCTTFGALYALAVMPQAPPGEAYFSYALQLLPGGLRGLFVAGVLCTILSTLDSYLFTASHVLTYDLAPRQRRLHIGLHHVALWLSGAAAVCLGLVFDGSIRRIWKLFGSYGAGCLLPPMMLGACKPGWVTDKGFVFGCCGGAVAITAWELWECQAWLARLDSVYIGVAGTCFGLLLARYCVPLLQTLRGNQNISRGKGCGKQAHAVGPC